MKKKIVLFGLMAGLTTFSSISSFAEGWKQDENGYWYERYDGSYPVGCTEWIDGNADGTYEKYAFDDNGYMIANRKIDETYSADANGIMYIPSDEGEPYIFPHGKAATTK